MAGDTETLAINLCLSMVKWRSVSLRMESSVLLAAERLHCERVSFAFGTKLLAITLLSHPLSKRQWMGFLLTLAVT